MTKTNKLLVTSRITVLGIVTGLSFLVAGMSAHITYFTLNFYKDFYGISIYEPFEGLCLASSALSLLALPAMVIIGATRRGAVLSMILVELLSLLVLWILWLVSAAKTASFNQTGAHCSTDFPEATAACIELQIVEAFAFLIWILLMVYTFVLLLFTIIATSRGHSGVWFSSVKETNFDAPPAPRQHNHEEKAEIPAPSTIYTSTPVPESQYPMEASYFNPQYPQGQMVTTAYPEIQHHDS